MCVYVCICVYIYIYIRVRVSTNTRSFQTVCSRVKLLHHRQIRGGDLSAGQNRFITTDGEASTPSRFAESLHICCVLSLFISKHIII